jgi:hypothetical protein
MKTSDEITISAAPNARQRGKFRLFGKRRSDKARLMLIINAIAAVIMVVLGYVLY